MRNLRPYWVIVVSMSLPACLAQTGRSTSTAHQHGLRAEVQTSAPIVIADGATNPTSIPDEVAFLHFFRFLAKNPNAQSVQADEARRASYIKFFFTTACGVSRQDDRSLTDSERTALLAYIDRINGNIAALSVSGTSSAMDLNDAVISGIVGMDASLGTDVARKVRSHVTDHMKPLIKIVQSQTGPSAQQPQ